MRYWIRVAEQTIGPFTPDEVRRQTGVTDETPVCPEGAQNSTDWRRLKEVPELAMALRGIIAPTPPQSASTADKQRDLKQIVMAALRARRKK
jgi:hypothetical protein